MRYEKTLKTARFYEVSLSRHIGKMAAEAQLRIGFSLITRERLYINKSNCRQENLSTKHILYIFLVEADRTLVTIRTCLITVRLSCVRRSQVSLSARWTCVYGQKPFSGQSHQVIAVN